MSMARLRNVNSGAIVEVDDEKVERMGTEWEPADDKKAPAKKAASKSDKK